jgi:hypothetical protein
MFSFVLLWVMGAIHIATSPFEMTTFGFIFEQTSGIFGEADIPNRMRSSIEYWTRTSSLVGWGALGGCVVSIISWRSLR